MGTIRFSFGGKLGPLKGAKLGSLGSVDAFFHTYDRPNLAEALTGPNPQERDGRDGKPTFITDTA